MRLPSSMVRVLPDDNDLHSTQRSEIRPRIDVFRYGSNDKRYPVRSRRREHKGALRAGYILSGIGVSFGPLRPCSHNHSFKAMKYGFLISSFRSFNLVLWFISLCLDNKGGPTHQLLPSVSHSSCNNLLWSSVSDSRYALNEKGMEFNGTNPILVEEEEVPFEDPGTSEPETEDKEGDAFSFLLAGPAPSLGAAENISIRVRWRFAPPAAVVVVFATVTSPLDSFAPASDASCDAFSSAFAAGGGPCRSSR